MVFQCQRQFFLVQRSQCNDLKTARGEQVLKVCAKLSEKWLISPYSGCTAKVDSLEKVLRTICQVGLPYTNER